MLFNLNINCPTKYATWILDNFVEISLNECQNGEVSPKFVFPSYLCLNLQTVKKPTPIFFIVLGEMFVICIIKLRKYDIHLWFSKMKLISQFFDFHTKYAKFMEKFLPPKAWHSWFIDRARTRKLYQKALNKLDINTK